MKNKENQRIRLTKTLLKTSLIDLLTSKPLHKITIKELCIHADINRSTFYLYYKDQFDLLREMEEELLDHVKEHMEKIDSNLDNFHHLKALMTYSRDHADQFRVLLSRTENLSFQTNFIEVAMKSLKLNLNLNLSENIADYIYNYLIAGCLSMINKWIENEFDLSVDELSNLIFQLSDKAVAIYSKP